MHGLTHSVAGHHHTHAQGQNTEMWELGRIGSKLLFEDMKPPLSPHQKSQHNDIDTGQQLREEARLKL
jgi:hypothetical protein